MRGLDRQARRVGDVVPETTENGVLGTKIMWAYFRDFVRLARRTRRLEDVGPGDVPKVVLPNLRRYVWIRRQDSDEDVGAQGLRFSFTAVNHLKLRIDEHNAAWQGLFQACGVEPLKVVYEELVDDYERTVLRLLDGTGILVPENFAVEKPSMKRQADELSEEWVILYNERAAAKVAHGG